MTGKTLILICNAHIDPVWLWEWEEGLAETLSTFRIAARFCEDYEGFVFNHNEALLYRYVEIYEPELFERIRHLVSVGKWHIMGGWFLQPDCNMPSGEALVRQILTGKRYVKEKFNVEPDTAVNFDPFGHSRGLVQILVKSGYSSYLFCRPDHNFLTLPDLDFIWVGYDGSEIMAHRPFDHYNSMKGLAAEKIRNWITDNKERKNGLILWGIGNHGGGPSKEDLEKISLLIKNEHSRKINHGTPEEYFKRLTAGGNGLARVERDINPFAVGCYTSMQKVKKKYRELENLYFLSEKMCTLARLQGMMKYPGEALEEALGDLLFCQFHDVLPGTSTPEVEEYTLQRLHHGKEILGRLRMEAFIYHLSGHLQGKEGEFPFMIFNPHPFDVIETIKMEFQAPEPNLNEKIIQLPEVKDENGELIESQLEKESSNIVVDHRKRVVFRAPLKASSMNRFSCYFRQIPAMKKDLKTRNLSGFSFPLKDGRIEINPETGLIDSYEMNGEQLLRPDSAQFLVMDDNADPWGMTVRSFKEKMGEFVILPPGDAAGLAGVNNERLEPVHIIEEGPVRTVVEALFGFGNSKLVVRYKIPKKGNEIELEARIYWQEKDKMLKLSFLTNLKDVNCFGQVVYGLENFNRQGEELVAQRWIGVESSSGNSAITIINDATYGFDFREGEVRLSLLRSPAYAGHPVKEGQAITPQNRFEPRIDQGESQFRFWLNAGPFRSRRMEIHKESLTKNEPPFGLCCYPSGQGEKLPQGIILSNPVVQLSALKMAEDNNNLILRLFEPSGENAKTEIRIPGRDMSFQVEFIPFEIKTLSLNLQTGQIREMDLLEREIVKA